MKIPWNKEATIKVLTGSAIITVGIIVYFIFLRFSDFWSSIQWVFSIFKPFVWGFVIAYLVNYLMRFVERHILKKLKKPRLQRVLALCISYVLFLIMFGLFLFLLLPQTIESVAMLIGDLPGYITNLTNAANALIDKYQLSGMVADWIAQFNQYFEENVAGLLSESVTYTLSLTTRVANIVLNLFIAVFISIYFLAKKEKYGAQMKKTLYAYLNKDRGRRLVDFAGMASRTFGDFLVGKLLDSLIIGVICFVCLTLFGFPFPLLISVIVGATNIIPFFGPFIGAIPSFLIILMADPHMALWFLLFILVLQQIDGNIIGPKILGFSVGVSALWILFAILIGGSMFGFMGMLLGVPTFAIVYTLFKNHTEKRLAEQGLPTASKDYASEENKIRF